MFLEAWRLSAALRRIIYTLTADYRSTVNNISLIGSGGLRLAATSSPVCSQSSSSAAGFQSALSLKAFPLHPSRQEDSCCDAASGGCPLPMAPPIPPLKMPPAGDRRITACLESDHLPCRMKEIFLDKSIEVLMFEV